VHNGDIASGGKALPLFSGHRKLSAPPREGHDQGIPPQRTSFANEMSRRARRDLVHRSSWYAVCQRDILPAIDESHRTVKLRLPTPNECRMPVLAVELGRSNVGA
jgi:hypothetical protein